MVKQLKNKYSHGYWPVVAYTNSIIIFTLNNWQNDSYQTYFLGRTINNTHFKQHTKVNKSTVRSIQYVLSNETWFVEITV